MFSHRLALQAGEVDVEAMKNRIPWRQLVRWFAFYQLEPWGQEWRRSGRQTALIRSALLGRFDEHDEERFSITYREGDEFRSKIPKTQEELAEGLAQLPGLKRKKRQWVQSARSRRSSRHPRPG
jgi:hypothetical protein